MDNPITQQEFSQIQRELIALQKEIADKDDEIDKLIKISHSDRREKYILALVLGIIIGWALCAIL